MRPAPETRHDGQDTVGEQAEQRPHKVAREKRHVARRDEYSRVPGGEETGFDAGERPLATSAQVGNAAGSGGDVYSFADEKYLCALGGQGFVDPVEEGRVADL
jgi:hypothetical protein